MTFFLMYMSIGVIAGFTGGMLGVGGGAVTVPLLLWVFSLQGISDAIATQLALATSLGAMIVTSASSTRAHANRDAVLWGPFRFLAVGVLAGSIGGVITAVNVPGAALQCAFAAFLLYVSLQMIRGFSVSAHRTLPGGGGLTLAGGVIGMVSMFFGIGGGSLTVPFLSWCGVKAQRAVGTSAALGLPIAIWGSIMYMWSGWSDPLMPPGALGYVYLPAVMGIAVTSVVFARIGAWCAHRLNPTQLRHLFGFILMAVALELAWENLG